jgi:hypothetical protein
VTMESWLTTTVPFPGKIIIIFLTILHRYASFCFVFKYSWHVHQGTLPLMSLEILAKQHIFRYFRRSALTFEDIAQTRCGTWSRSLFLDAGYEILQIYFVISWFNLCIATACNVRPTMLRNTFPCVPPISRISLREPDLSSRTYVDCFLEVLCVSTWSSKICRRSYRCDVENWCKLKVGWQKIRRQSGVK